MKARTAIAAAAILIPACATVYFLVRARDLQSPGTTRLSNMPEPSHPPSSPLPARHLPLLSRATRIAETPNFADRAADRVAAARTRAGGNVQALFADAGVAYPAGEVFLRGFKREGDLELWAGSGSGPLRLIAIYAVARHSGGPGPKRREGDLQVPEGFYEVDRFNPQSSFHLSLGINYPNAADRILGHPQTPGYDIFIHGSDASVGCLAMGDDRIEEIYLAALDSRARPIHVHLFPARLDAPEWPEWRDEVLTQKPECTALWQQLAEGFAQFEKTKRVPVVSITAGGEYRISP